MVVFREDAAAFRENDAVGAVHRVDDPLGFTTIVYRVDDPRLSSRMVCGRVILSAPPPCGRLRPCRTSQYTYRLAAHNLHLPPGLSGPFVVLAQGRGLRG